MYIKDIPNAINNTNKFLVSDGGVLKYRTTSEMLSDLGVSGGGSVSLPSNQVAFGTGSNISGSNNLTYNGSTLTINASSIDVSKYADYKLAVNGNAIFTRVKVKESAQWPDYVFERNYQLPSLKEVEAFIKQHKHLPEENMPPELVLNTNTPD